MSRLPWRSNTSHAFWSNPVEQKCCEDGIDDTVAKMEEDVR